MTPADLARIEKDLSVSLPQSYREAMMRPEFQGDATGFPEFSGVADEIIALNLDVWEEGFAGVKWPDHFLVIGEAEAGNFYFTDLTKETPAVFLTDHEQTNNQTRLVTSENYETFADFLAVVHRLQAGRKNRNEPQAKAPAPKPWWRFWGD